MEIKKKNLERRVINEEEAISFVDVLGPHIGGEYIDNTYNPFYLNSRKDTCIVIRSAADGYSYGYDTAYLLWKSTDKIDYEKLIDTSYTKDNINIKKFSEDSKNLIIELTSSGTYSGKSWTKKFTKSKRKRGLKE